MIPSLLAQVSDEVKAILRTAQDEAREMGHGYIGTEHVLIALLGQGSSPGIDEARRQGATPDAARQTAQDNFAAAEGALTYVPDDMALEAVGVDLEAVRRRAEAQFGPEALPLRVGAPAFTPRVKTALEGAAVAGGRAGRPASTDDLLIGLLSDSESVAGRFLTETCSELDAVADAAQRAERG